MVTSCNDQCIHTDISWGDNSAIFSFVYVQPNNVSIWDHMKGMSVSINKPWLVMGDFHDFSLLGERKGGER